MAKDAKLSERSWRGVALRRIIVRLQRIFVTLKPNMDLLQRIFVTLKPIVDPL